MSGDIPEGYIEIPMDTPAPLTANLLVIVADMSPQEIQETWPYVGHGKKACRASYKGWGCTRAEHTSDTPHVGHFDSGQACAIWFEGGEGYRKLADD